MVSVQLGEIIACRDFQWGPFFVKDVCIIGFYYFFILCFINCFLWCLGLLFVIYLFWFPPFPLWWSLKIAIYPIELFVVLHEMFYMKCFTWNVNGRQYTNRQHCISSVFVGIILGSHYTKLFWGFFPPWWLFQFWIK